MNRQIKVSIILPSLNVAMYIEECMKSVLNQSLPEIEIICVDAGSTDGTLEILRNYERLDERVKLLQTSKKSYGYQMNLGISVALGEYIGIVETDDYVPKEMYRELYKIAKDKDLDFVKANFYRFTGSGKELNRTLFRLTEDNTFYNRVINIENEQQCFLFPVNTWSGIYNRKFLQENDIYHNETPGASFQDTGFWFQTFACAKKAFFLDKSYYMNRRDNAESSVFNKNKIFCLCDEYDFIEAFLKKKSLFQNFKYSYAYVCFRAYWGNLIRVTKEFEKEYFERFYKKCFLLCEQDALDAGKFSRTEWRIISSLLENPEDFYEKIIIPKMKIFDELQKYEEIIIYGAGTVGKNVLNMILYHTKPEKIYCFAVSKIEKDSIMYRGIPIYDIHNLTAHREKSLVVVAVSEKFRLEIYKTLDKLGFIHVITI